MAAAGGVLSAVDALCMPPNLYAGLLGHGSTSHTRRRRAGDAATTNPFARTLVGGMRIVSLTPAMSAGAAGAFGATSNAHSSTASASVGILGTVTASPAEASPDETGAATMLESGLLPSSLAMRVTSVPVPLQSRPKGISRDATPPAQAKMSSHRDVAAPFLLGERVSVFGRSGTVRYSGVVGSSSGIQIGVELDEPREIPDNCLYSAHFFACEPRCGVFVLPGQAMRQCSGLCLPQVEGCLRQSRYSLGVEELHLCEELPELDLELELPELETEIEVKTVELELQGLEGLEGLEGLKGLEGPGLPGGAVGTGELEEASSQTDADSGDSGEALEDAWAILGSQGLSRSSSESSWVLAEE
mmetsp:Transcript_36727/g.80523  ORF Transcript_36727/g.80523 Transcript_36727/m.80523 type:complete len:359 (-) Transcript_36727:332-1408(-)|eukprot:CAMPEP_0170616610 /NCGR_PEP_ID=MMETSP0224-20130122/25960_1 /TAXON_ID=285029 /ORGANISM="Togula jolla, Strain CCCM 725" /LENGTH=358 /DNA_ID=CAMNT_0010942415 /DNA_START=131 /DNA_END=1207 /DNA_ORIENTATION=+